MDFITIVILSLIGLVSLIAIIGLLWIINNAQKEKKLRARLKDDSKKRNRIFWDELITANKGYKISDLNHCMRYVVPVLKSKKDLLHIEIKQSNYHFMVAPLSSKDVYFETHAMDDNVEITKIDDINTSYMITETIYHYNMSESSIEKSNRIHIYATKQLLDAMSKIVSVNNVEPIIKKDYQLIYVKNNQIEIIWHETLNGAKTRMKQMMNDLTTFNDLIDFNNNGKVDQDYIEISESRKTFDDNYYNLENDRGTLRLHGDKHDWLIVYINNNDFGK